MRRKTQNAAKPFRRVLLGLLAVTALFVPTTAANARPPAADTIIELPGASGAEGIAAGHGTTFYAGDLIDGHIYRGDVRTGIAEPFINAPDGRSAVGMKVDLAHDLLFVAGGATGQGYVYDINTGTSLAVYQFAAPGPFINDVTINDQGAWFTNSARGELYLVPISDSGELGDFETLPLSSPAGDLTGPFNLNGIATAADGHTLIVAHSANAALYTVDPNTGASAPIVGVSVPNVDGIVVQGNQLWAVQNALNQVSRIQLHGNLTSGTLREVITSPDFSTPTTAALFGNTLAVVNAKFFTPGATEFEVVLVDAR